MKIEKINRRSFIQTGVTAGAMACAWPALAQQPTPAHSVKVSPDKPFRVLQITDIHFYDDSDEVNQKSVKHIRAIVDRFTPDFIAVTGDFWHENPDGKGLALCEWSSAQIGAIGLPWLFAWGNHDAVDDRQMAHDILENAPHSLYSRGDGNGNYRIALMDKTTETPLWQFFMLNTERVGISKRETDWLTNECRSLPSSSGFIFCHIPVLQYKQIWDEKIAAGIKNEEVCNEKEDGSALGAISQTGKVQAMFVGHDHVNDYSGVIDGVNLVYGRATGFGGYGGDKVEKGATLIEIHPAQKEYTYMSVFPDGRTWKQNKEA